MKKKIYLILYTLSFLLVWMFLLVANTEQNMVLLGLVYSFASPFLVQLIYDKPFDKWEKLLVSIGPVFYVIGYVYVQAIVEDTARIFDFISPLFLGFYLFLFSIFHLRRKKDVLKLPFYILGILLYTWFVFPVISSLELNYRYRPDVENFSGEDKKQNKLKSDRKEDVDLKKIDLKEFDFINLRGDTITLGHNNKFTLLETWNETCLPCVISLKNMQSFYASIKDKVNVYYVYENRHVDTQEKFDKIFNYKLIEEKSAILIDIEQKMFEAINMNSYPYFVLFNNEGEIVFKQKGFNLKKKGELEKNILNLFVK